MTAEDPEEILEDDSDSNLAALAKLTLATTAGIGSAQTYNVGTDFAYSLDDPSMQVGALCGTYILSVGQLGLCMDTMVEHKLTSYTEDKLSDAQDYFS